MKVRPMLGGQMGGFLFEYNHLTRPGRIELGDPFDKLLKVTELVLLR